MRTRARRGTVHTHTRTVNGRPVAVRQHSRGLSPRRAGRRAVRGVKAYRKGHKWIGVALGAGAVAEAVLWVGFRGTAVGLFAIGAVAGAMAIGFWKLTR